MSDSVGACGSLFLPSNRDGGRKTLPHQDLLSFLSIMVNGVGCHWTLSLLADEMVVLGLTDSISTETVRQALKKTTSSPGS
jgi:hypothetical protein